MNWFRAATLLVALLVSGCGSGSGADTGDLVRTHGLLVRVGGPAPGGPVAMPGVRLHLRGGGGSADVRTDGHGRFAVDLAPGTYTVSLRASGVPAVTAPHVIVVPHAGRLRLVVNVK